MQLLCFSECLSLRRSDECHAWNLTVAHEACDRKLRTAVPVTPAYLISPLTLKHPLPLTCSQTWKWKNGSNSAFPRDILPPECSKETLKENKVSLVNELDLLSALKFPGSCCPLAQAVKVRPKSKTLSEKPLEVCFWFFDIKSYLKPLASPSDKVTIMVLAFSTEWRAKPDLKPTIRINCFQKTGKDILPESIPLKKINPLFV